MRRKMFALSLKIPIPLRSAHGGLDLANPSPRGTTQHLLRTVDSHCVFLAPW